MQVCQEEIFGPVAVVIPFDTEEEALAIANDTDYGLGAGVWTTNLNRAHRMIRSIETGSVWVNTYRTVGPRFCLSVDKKVVDTVWILLWNSLVETCYIDIG